MIKRLFFVALALLLALGSPMTTRVASAEAGTVIKFAVVAPPGSKWMEAFNKMNRELETKSGGKLKMKIFAGGVMGDEKAVVRKIHQGQLQSAAFTGLGLGEILPSVRVLELPMLFDTTQEIDAVRTKLAAHFTKEFASKGFVLLAWSEVGFVYIFSNKPIQAMADLKKVKMWMWEGDQLAKTMFEEMNIAPVPLALPDVRTSLQTGLIDAVYSPPMGVTALQWNAKVRYMLNLKLTNSLGGLLVDKKTFDALSPDLQKLLKTTAESTGKQVIGYSRTQNDQTIAILKKQGIQITEVGAKDKAQYEEASRRVARKMAGVLYPASLLTEVGAILHKKI